LPWNVNLNLSLNSQLFGNSEDEEALEADESEENGNIGTVIILNKTI
jgi:hypothetical protein